MTSKPSLACRTALVTGAARRLGAAIALELARAGLDVAVHAHRSLDEAAALVERIRGMGRKAVRLEGDLADVSLLPDMVAAAEAALGPVDMLVNNAAIFRFDHLATLDAGELRAHLAINLEAPLLLTREVCRRLPAGRTGLIVNMLDQRVLNPTGSYLSYDVSKAALWSATQVLARELAPRVRVNAIGPGLVMAPESMPAARFAQLVETTPLGRATEAQEVARTVRHILESPSMTGNLILVDGGRHMGWAVPPPVAPQ